MGVKFPRRLSGKSRKMRFDLSRRPMFKRSCETGAWSASNFRVALDILANQESCVGALELIVNADDTIRHELKGASISHHRSKLYGR